MYIFREPHIPVDGVYYDAHGPVPLPAPHQGGPKDLEHQNVGSDFEQRSNS